MTHMPPSLLHPTPITHTQSGAPNPTVLGTFAWSCVWVDNADPDQIVPCQGLISLKSGKQARSKGYPMSNAMFSFWAPTVGLANLFLPDGKNVVRETRCRCFFLFFCWGGGGLHVGTHFFTKLRAHTHAFEQYPPVDTMAIRT